MSDEMERKPEWLDALEQAQKASDDPVIGGLVNIGNDMLEGDRQIDKRVDGIEKEVDEVKRQVVKESESLKNQMAAGFKVTGERLASVSKRQLMGIGTGGSGITPSGDRLLAVIPEEQRHLVRQAELEINRKKSDGDALFTKSPEFYTTGALWFGTAIKLMCPRRFGGQQVALKEELDRYDRAFKEEFPHDEFIAKASYAEGADGTGGYLVPTPIAAEVLRIVQDSGVVVSRGRHIPMGSNQMNIPNEATGVTVYWGAEAQNLTAGEGTFGQNILVAKRLHGRATASIEVIEDSVIGLIPYITNVMAEKIGKELDQEALEGDGTNFTGLNAESGINTVATTTTDGEALAYLDLVNAVYAADESSVEDNAVWFMHRKIFATVVGLVDDNGRPIFQPAVEARSPGTILGFPVYTTSALATNTTRGSTGDTSNVYFGNPRRLIFGDRQGLRFDVTDTGPGWANYQVDMRLVGRFGFTVGTPAAFSRIVGCTQL